MTGVLVEIPNIKWESQRTLKLDKGFREVVADYLRRRWPSHTAKNAARTFDLSMDRAREAVAGRVSLTTLEQIFKRGGFSVALPILADVIGQSLARYFRELRTAHDEQGEHIAALVGDLRPLGADPAARDTDAARALAGGRGAVGDRSARKRG
jgi:hypothetical protein